MSKKLEHSAIAICFLVLCCFLSAPVRADVQQYAHLTFQSGATFSGTIDFTSNYTQITGVNGTLYGYQYGTFGYSGAGSETLSWIWYQGTNFVTSGGNVFGTSLMDGPSGVYTFGPGGYYNWVNFSYDYTNAPNLALATGATFWDGYQYYVPNSVDGDFPSYGVYSDPLVSGTVSPTPEPGTLLLLGSGLTALAGIASRRRIKRT